MNRASYNRESKGIFFRGLMYRRGAAFLLFMVYALLIIAMLVIGSLHAHGQLLSAKNFPGLSVGTKVTNAQNNGCNPDTNVTCVIVIEPELSVFAAGTLPTPSARTVILDYRSATLGLQAAFAGSNTLIPTNFNGGPVSNPITLPDGTCAAPAITNTSASSGGWFKNAANAWTWCAASIAHFTLSATLTKLDSGSVLCWSSTAQSTGVCDAGISRDSTAGAGNIDFGNGAANDVSATLRAKRYKASGGTALVTGDVSGLTGWGTTATVSAVTGNDQGGSVTIAASGTGQAANASFTLTFHDGTWTTAPTCVISRGDQAAPAGSFQGVANATALVPFLNPTAPTAGQSYTMVFVCMGR